MQSRYYLRSEGILLKFHSPVDWALGQTLAYGEMTIHNAIMYLAMSPHLATADYEPGVGDDWEDVFFPMPTGPQGIQGIPGDVLNWRGEYDDEEIYAANDGVLYNGRGFYALQASTGHAPPDDDTEANAYWSCFADRGHTILACSGAPSDSVGRNGDYAFDIPNYNVYGPKAAGSWPAALNFKGDAITTLWKDMPGSPTRISDTSFSITDSGNANLYDKVYSPQTVISWQKSGGGWQAAKIITASYSSNAVTFTIKGNTLSSGFTGMKYCILRAHEDSWAIPGRLPTAALTNIGRLISWREDRYVFSAVVVYGTAATTTGDVWDINDDGSSIFSTKPPIAASATEGTETVCNSLLSTATTAVAAKSKMTLDYDSGYASTPGSDAVVFIWSMPVAWRYTP